MNAKPKNAQDVKKFILGMQGLSTIPVMLTKIVKTCSDEHSRANDLHNLITADPALAERVLRIANSVLFGRSGQIKDIQQAIMFLGFERIKSTALGMTVMSAFPAGDTSTADSLWTHSYEVAFLASSLTKLVPGTVAGECFLAGLFHDIGRIIFFMMDYDRFLGIASWDDMPDQERAAYGCTHAEAGTWLAESLGIPKPLIPPIAFHHHPLEAKEQKDLVAVIALAEGFSRRFSPRIEDDGIWTAEHDDLLKRYSISDDKLEAIGDRLVEARPEIESMFIARR